jgi:hypothetical protein
MSDSLSVIARATGDLIHGPAAARTPGAALALAERLEAFAAAEPRLSADTRTNLLTQLARTVDPAAPRDADAALALLRAAAV